MFSIYKMEEFVEVCGISKWSVFRICMEVKALKCQDTFPLMSVGGEREIYKQNEKSVKLCFNSMTDFNFQL